jgi:hypothetical protein
MTIEKHTSVRSSYGQNAAIKQHLASMLEGTSERYVFDWNYWITITMGRNPSVELAEDILYKTHHRIDNRILKHSGKSVMTRDERSEWILFPEKEAGNGLHYHGFIKLNVNPNLGNSYENEWSWMRTAFANTLSKFDDLIESSHHISFRIYERRYRIRDDLKMLFYTMKELGNGDTFHDINHDFDNFAHLIISRNHWKTGPLHKHRSATKLEDIPIRHNKVIDTPLTALMGS